jgi:hypothetical protein
MREVKNSLVSNPMMQCAAFSLAVERRLPTDLALAPYLSNCSLNSSIGSAVRTALEFHTDPREFGCRGVYGKPALDANKFTVYNG